MTDQQQNFEVPSCPADQFGRHYVDNQGGCHNCGMPMNADGYGAYIGVYPLPESHPQHIAWVEAWEKKWNLVWVGY